MMTNHANEVYTLADTLDAPLNELLDSAGALTLSQSFFGLFRIPIRVFSEDGTSLARSGDEPELHRMLGENAASSRQLGLLYARLKEFELGEAGERTHRSFTGASYHVVAIGHGGKRVGRAVLGPFVDGKLALDGFRRALENTADDETAERLAAELPRAKQDTVRSIGRHLVIVLGLILHESHQALLSTRMHLASMRETQRETQRQQHLADLAQDASVVLSQTQSCIVNDVAGAMQEQLQAISRELGSQQLGASAEVGGATSSVSEAQTLCSGLLDLSALESGKLEVNRERCDVSKLLNALKSELTDRGLAVEVASQSEISEVCVDSRALARCMGRLATRVSSRSPTAEQLVVEVRKACAEGDESSVGALLFLEAPKVADTEILLSFSVEGAGMPASISEALAPNASALAQGKELQVTIARRVAEAHGGKLSIKQKSSGGGVFALILSS